MYDLRKITDKEYWCFIYDKEARQAFDDVGEIYK